MPWVTGGGGEAMSLTLQEFFDAVARDRDLLSRGNAPAGVYKCAHCEIPLQESVTGNRNGMCSDCYFDDFGAELDSHPVASLRITRGG